MAKKAKLTKEEKKQRKKEAAERRRKEELEARLLAEEQERQLQEERRVQHEFQLRREAEERVLRREQLAESVTTLQLLDEKLVALKRAEYLSERWQLYRSCDGLPDPLSLPQLNAFISESRDYWLATSGATSGATGGGDDYQLTVQRCDVMLRVINRLSAALDDQEFANCAPQNVASMRAILLQCQELQQTALDLASYRLLTNLRPLVDLETNTVQHCVASRHVTLAFWANCSKNLRNRGYTFKEMGLRFELPRVLLDKDIAVRVLHSDYDFLSSRCRSTQLPDKAKLRMSERLDTVIVADDERVELELVAAAAAEAAEAARLLAEEEAAVHEAEANSSKGPAARMAAARAVSPAAKHTEQSGKDKTTGAGSKSPKPRDRSKSPKRKGGSKSPKRKGRSKSPKRKGRSKSPSPRRASVKAPEPPEASSVPARQSSLTTVTSRHELNLRHYRVIGGVLHVHLVKVPYQPVVVRDWTLRRVDDVQNLTVFPFEADYQPTAVDVANVDESGALRHREPQEIERESKRREAEMQKLATLQVDDSTVHGTGEKREDNTAAAAAASSVSPPATHATSTHSAPVTSQSSDVTSDAISDAVDAWSAAPADAASRTQSDTATAAAQSSAARHCLLHFRLPDRVLWFEPPVFVRWDSVNGYWSTDGFHDTRYNEDTRQIQTRCVSLGVIALAVNRFSNLPLQSWRFQPLSASSARLHITAALASLSLLIQNDRVCLEEVVGGSSSCLNPFYSQPMKPAQLIELLRSHGLDVFPEADSHAYVAGTPVKHMPCEQHLYRCMATIAGGYGMSSSRWNLLAGADNLVFLFREVVSPDQQGEDATLLVQPRRATIVQCTESASAFCDQQPDGIAFYADLRQLVQGLGSEQAKACVAASPIAYTDCVHTLLSSMRLLSYS